MVATKELVRDWLCLQSGALVGNVTTIEFAGEPVIH